MDPFSSAVLGAVVSGLLTEAITAARKAYHCKENCKKLVATLEELELLVNKVKENSDKNDTCKSFLLGFEQLLKDARCAAEECIWKSGVRKRERLKQLWCLRKLPSRISTIDRRIKDRVANSNLVTLFVTLSIEKQVIAVTKTTTIEFQTQPTPSKVVGLEGHLDKLKALIIAGHAKENPSYLGLKGRGGAGKTVIAQKLNNDVEIQATYGVDCILWITIGHDASVSSLYSTFGEFLRDEVFERKYRHRNEEDQRTYLTNAFSEKKMLLILDDVWKKQYNGREWIEWMDIAKGKGSVTLITTREDGVLSRVKAEVEVVLELSDKDSWELFHHHAFKIGMLPPLEIERVARKICNECRGLPLALKVIGSAMANKLDLGEWRSFLRDLEKSKADPHVVEELFYRLRLSYNELDEVTKKCFLYFAAFPEDYAIKINQLSLIWMADGLFESLEAEEAVDKVKTHLGILERGSLIDWNHKSNEAKVHDILRDLAGYIIRNTQNGEWASKCLFQPGSRFITFPIINLMQDLNRLSLIGNRMFEFPNDVHFPHLRICLASGIGNLDQKLVVPEAFFSSMADLRYLDLSKNHFEGKFPSFERLKSLMILNLSFCVFLTLSKSIGELKSLAHFDLSSCQSLKELPESIGELKSLAHFDLSRCESLKELPESIGELKSLAHFDLSRCGSLKELPKSIGELKSLAHFDLSRCGSLKELPESIGELKSLAHFDLSRCGSLKELPESIGELKSLAHFDLSWCGSLKELPESIGELKSLAHFNLGWCESLKELPESIGELKSLAHFDLSSCGSLKELPESIGELKSLAHFDLSSCGSLKELPESIGELKSLAHFDLGWCESLKELPKSIGELKSLAHFDLSRCGSLKELPKSIGELKSLAHFDLSRCGSLKELPESIGELKSLAHFDLSRCGSLKELPESIGELKSLAHFDLSRCGSLKELPESIGELKSLAHFDLSWCGSLKELPESIGELKSLAHFNLGWCESLKELPESIGELKSLAHFDLSWCGSLKELPESIGELKSLAHFDLGWCKSLKELPESIGELKSLAYFDLGWCESLKELPESIGELKSLAYLILRGCESLKELPESIGELKSLAHFALSRCGSLKELPESIGELKSLAHFDLSSCGSLKELPESIGELKSLAHFDLRGCGSLKELPESIGELKSLAYLILRGCGSLKELPKSIGELKSLVHLDLRSCGSLKELLECIGELEFPESVGKLRIMK